MTETAAQAPTLEDIRAAQRWIADLAAGVRRPSGPGPNGHRGHVDPTSYPVG